jgi:nucleoside-diphosphate-sugar epimerase
VSTALVGHTGFVGGNLLRQTRFDDLYHRANIDSIRGRRYEVLVVSGTPAAKWIANRDPEADAANVQRLMRALDAVSADRIVLISTVDVYPSPVLVDESSPIDVTAQHAYGRHRFLLEQHVQRLGRRCLVVRLPGLFGSGLRKNAIYDLLHGNEVHKIHAQSSYQFYDLNELWRDVNRCLAAGLELVNFATEPVTMRQVASDAFGIDFANTTDQPPAHYDFRTRHDAALGGARGYLYDKTDVLDRLRRFVESERKASP